MDKRLLKLLADNRRCAARRPLAVRALAADEAELFVYDVIVDSEIEAEWWGGIAPEAFVAALRDVTAGTLHLRINSPGGSVFAARAMETALREFRGRVVTHVDGLAASAATLLAGAGAERVIAKGAQFMVHQAWTWLAGNAADLRKMAELLDKTDAQLAESYADRTGNTAEQALAWMQAETWFTGREAVEAGFADRLAEDDATAAQAAAWNLSAYGRAPRAQPPAPQPQPAPARVDAAALLRRLQASALPA
ncbi:MAG: Clp protease ClpP [Rubrivivax sp.]|nr:Clp protease ClpP [Rubrivivax sp.]